MLRLYNFLTRRKQLFRPIHHKWMSLYTCGPTVYNFAHIGNLRTYLFEDALRRTLESQGYRVRHVMNITDVDDKIIRDAAEAHKPINEFVKPYEATFFQDLKKLNIAPARNYPRATEHIPAMIAIIRKLLGKGLAYEMNGSVYFAISRFKPYGALSRLRQRTIRIGARVDVDEYSKGDLRDFVLWKAAKSGEPSWDTPWGKGRPGWHLECSAMSMKYLGTTFDIHAGAVDLLFPHHENEIAQSQGATGKPFVRFFVEGEHLLVDGEKMSKSLGNILTLREIEARGFDPLAFRYLTLTAHYRAKLNFTWESLAAAQKSLERLIEFAHSLRSAPQKRSRETLRPIALNPFKTRFFAGLLDDLDTPRALAVLWNLAHRYWRNPGRFDRKQLLRLVNEFDNVLGLRLQQTIKAVVPPDIRESVQRREEFRKQKQWKEADALRTELAARGWTVEDSPEGPRVTQSFNEMVAKLFRREMPDTRARRGGQAKRLKVR